METVENIDRIINSRRLPKDELDKFLDNLFGFAPAIGFLIAGLGPVIAPKTTMSQHSISVSLAFGIILFSYTLYSKLTERKLKLLKTGLSKEDNEKLIKSISRKEKWMRVGRGEYFHAFNIPSFCGFKLTLIAVEDGILINLRNRGTIKGRMPYLFGIETIKRLAIERKIRLNIG